jgi:hypothetical protein
MTRGTPSKIEEIIESRIDWISVVCCVNNPDIAISKLSFKKYKLTLWALLS